ncbi:MAG: type IV pilus assembly protein FimV [Burkholderiaceae bacterium]
MALSAWAPWSMAVGLGPIQMQSGLGQPLQASVPLLSAGTAETGGYCIKAQVSTPDGTLIVAPQAGVRGGDRPNQLVLTSRQPINEPAVTVSVDFGCVNRVHRDFTVLLDFPTAAPVPLPAERQPMPQPEQRPVDRTPPVQATRAPASASMSGGAATAPENPAPTVRRAIKRKPAPAVARAAANPAADPAANPAEPDKPVLRLTADEIPSPAGMRMSDTLVSDAGASAPTKTPDDTRAERERFAAMMRGEDTDRKQAEDLRVMQEKLRALSLEIAQLRQQSLTAQATKNENESMSATLAASLGAALLLALGAAGWLALRLRDAGRRNEEAWWDDMARDPETEPKDRAAGVREIHVDDSRRPSDTEPMSPSNVSRFPRFPAKTAARRPEPPADTDAVGATRPAGEEPGNAAAGVPEDNGINFHDSVSFNVLSGVRGQQTRMPKVEVISDVVQEAEFWMLLNNPQRALQILEPYGVDQRPDSPVAWLYLLDLYRSLDRREDYDGLAGRFKRIFNARIPAWGEQENYDAPASLEDFPRLVDNICKLWSDDQAVPYLESLLIDDRNGERVGFDLPVYREIIMLIGIATDAARGRRQVAG